MAVHQARGLQCRQGKEELQNREDVLDSKWLRMSSLRHVDKTALRGEKVVVGEVLPAMPTDLLHSSKSQLVVRSFKQ